VEQATAAYRREQDVIERFLAECCQFGDSYRIAKKELREALAGYCDENGDEAPSAVAFGRRLAEFGVTEAGKIGNRKAYRGIRVLPAESEDA
jgi:hypothetical protein